MRKIAEMDKAIAPYWQRTVYEVHPELSFFQLNGDVACRAPKRTLTGQGERADLLKARLPGVERIIDRALSGVGRYQLLDAAVCLWTARRVLSRAVSRIPEMPEWDAQGLRMEIVR
jgi:predicted RNase H-like nuclease